MLKGAPRSAAVGRIFEDLSCSSSWIAIFGFKGIPRSGTKPLRAAACARDEDEVDSEDRLVDALDDPLSSESRSLGMRDVAGAIGKASIEQTASGFA